MAINIPTDLNNPGAIRSSTGSFQSNATPLEGQIKLYNDLTIKMTGKSKNKIPGTNKLLTGDSTLYEFTQVYAPKGDGKNNPAAYAADLANQLGVSPDTKIGTLLPRIDDFAKAVANHEGYKGVWAGSHDTKSGLTKSTQNLPGIGALPSDSITSSSQLIGGGYSGKPSQLPQGHSATGLLTMLGTGLGMQPFGAGLSTLDKTAQKTAAKIGEQENQGQQALIKAIQKEKDPAKKQRLVSFLKTQYGANFTPTAEELNPALGLSNGSVIGSAGLTALGALAGGSVSQPGMIGGQIARNAAVKGSVPVLARLAKSGYGAAKATQAGQALSKGGLIGKLLRTYGTIQALKHSPAKGIAEFLDL